jgi:hypothetical protein
MKTIKLIKILVEQELKEIDGGIMDPNMVPFVPHREPAADTANEPEEPNEVDHLYRAALKARLATEELVKALEDPIYDEVYEASFKATMALRDALNGLESLGANPKADERVVAPIPGKPVQPDSSASAGTKYIPMAYTGQAIY